MIKNKKAAIIPIWVPGLVLVAFVVLTTAVIFLNQKFGKLPNIGESQQQVFEAAMAAENSLVYLDASANLAAQQAVVGTAFEGGYSFEPKCGTYMGFNLWTAKDAECYPSPEDVKSSILYHIDAGLKIYLSNYKELNLPADYRYSAVSPKLTVVGSAINNIQIDVISRAEAVKTPVAGVPVTTPTTPTIPTVNYIPLVKYTPAKTDKDALANIYKNYGTLIKEASVKYKVPEEMIAGIIMMESTGNPNLVNKEQGCSGIAQFCRTTAYQYGLCDCKLSDGSNCPPSGGSGRRYCIEKDDRLIPEKEIDAEAHYLGDLLVAFDRYSDKKKFAVASYTIGKGVILKAIKKAENTGKIDPKWEDVAEQLTPDLLTYFKTYSEQDKTVKIVKQIYIPKTTSFQEVYASLEVGTALA